MDGFVLPHAYDAPSGSEERSVSVAVTFDIDPELGHPPRPGVDRSRPMRWAAVPEAPIYEHSDALCRKYNVRPSSKAS